MEIRTCETLRNSRCTPCEGGVPRFSAEEAQSQLAELNDWVLSNDSTSISKSWNCKTFAKSLEFANRIGEIAEHEQHHPDLHLTGYRHLKVVLTTHAIGGLSENDFILASKIDQLKANG